jgi:hypothetical protein
MSQADEIRNYCIENYIKPYRLRREKGVFISVGEIHRNMNLSNSYPAVCAAIGSQTFENDANVKRVCIDGPLNGASTIFAFIFNVE